MPFHSNGKMRLNFSSHYRFLRKVRASLPEFRQLAALIPQNPVTRAGNRGQGATFKIARFVDRGQQGVTHEPRSGPLVRGINGRSTPGRPAPIGPIGWGLYSPLLALRCDGPWERDGLRL